MKPLLILLCVVTALPMAAQTITAASPTCTAAGSRDLVMTIYGAGFARGDTVLLMCGAEFGEGDLELKPSYLSSRMIRVTVPAKAFIQAGKWRVMVFQPESLTAKKAEPSLLKAVPASCS